ncbi:MAG: carboxypeptidase regulatory-like domain-containing protein [Muribaculaceae bacterium]|nr:carboxypeptidase regulatory-like domain-containing protein [Muribaculaceae bacterium]
MKKFYYLILFTIFALAYPSSLLANSQLLWKIESAKSANELCSYQPSDFDKNIPNISITKNYYATIKSDVENKDIYGFSMTNPNDRTLLGLVKFNTGNPTDVSHISKSTEYVRAGAFANDKYYMASISANYPKGFYTANLNTGELTLVANYIQNGDVRAAIDMSYDYSTETMFIICNGDGNTNTALRTVDLTTGDQTLINNNMGHYFRAIAVNIDGNMFGIDGNGMLCSIDKATGEATNIAFTGRKPFFFQSMEFDHDSGILYWACCEATHNSELCIVDPTNATTTSLGLIGAGTRGEQIVALYIPFKMANAGAPAKVTDLKVVANSDGNNSAVISWTNPANTYSGEALSSISKVDIFRDGVLINTITDAVPGQASSFTDNVENAASYIYKVIPYNSDGAGVAKSASAYIGHDLPSAVENALAVRASASSINISWNASTLGINNGYLDISTIKYKVTRCNDKFVVADNITTNSITDNSISSLERYTYDIEVSNADGIGGVTTTNYVVTGPNLNIPYVADFSKDLDASLWTVVDNNRDGNTFAIGYNYLSKANEYVYTANTSQADDWVVSPMISLEAGKYYKIIADVKCGRADRPEQCSIYLIKDRNLNNAVKLGDDFTISDPSSIIKCRADVNNADGGDYAIAVRCSSAAAADHFAVSAVSIEINHDGNIRGDVWDNNDNPIEGVVVSVVGNDFSATTDAKGQFEIINVPQGSYSLSLTKLGYKADDVPVAVTELKTTNVELDITARNKYSISGNINNEYGEPLSNTEISVSGYNSYTAISNATGKFNIDGVYEAEDAYSIKASKAFYDDAANTIAITNTNTSTSLILNDLILAPATVSATTDDAESIANINWSNPGLEYVTDIHDTAISATFGANDGTANTLIGMMVHKPVAISTLNWIDYFFSADINIVILALDKNGKITSDVLYIDEQAKNNMADLSTYQLPETIIAPNGCFIGLSCDKGSLGIGTVAPTSAYPFLATTWGVIDDYKISTEITYVENIGASYMENFFLDFKGYLLATNETEAPTVNYNIVRSNESNDNTSINESPISALYLSDISWANLAIGKYKYGVSAVYRNNKASNTTVSNVINKSTSGVDKVTFDTCNACVIGNHIVFSQQVNSASLYAINGTLVASGAEYIAIDNLAEGIYIVKMNCGNKIITQKIIIK